MSGEATVAVLAAVANERARQDAKWGLALPVHLPDGTGEQWRSAANRARQMCDEADAAGTLTWRHILDEEFCEASAESDPHLLVRELLQVAAVAVKHVETIAARTGIDLDELLPSPPRLFPDGLLRLKSAHSCRGCRRWLEGEWSRATGAEQAEIERQMDKGECDACTERRRAAWKAGQEGPGALRRR